MKIYLNRVLILLLFLGMIFSCSDSNSDNNENIKPKYIFLFIGDGMGTNHVSLTEGYIAGLENEIGMSNLTMTTFPYFGLCTTYSKSSNITDSGAAGSAIACGEKANNGVISYFPDQADSLKPVSIAKIAHQNNFKVGIISTVSINHATPAAFYASNQSRSNYYDIGLQLPESRFEFFGGGGFKNPDGSENSQTNLYLISEQSGYTLCDNLATISSLNSDNSKILFTNPVLQWEQDMPYAIDRDVYGGYNLKEIVSTAIEFLYNDTGFFIMVEGGKIDWASHSNDAATIIGDVQDFDNALFEAYTFYLDHPEETLIIVTADHETGGLSLGNNQNGYNGEYAELNLQACSIGYFSSKISNYKNTHSSYFMNDIEQLAEEFFLTRSITLTELEYSKLNNAFNYYFYNTTNMSENELYEIYGSYNPIAASYVDIINSRSSVSFSTWSHTGTRVPVYAIGQKAELFSGGIDNTDFHRIICEFMEW